MQIYVAIFSLYRKCVWAWLIVAASIGKEIYFISIVSCYIFHKSIISDNKNLEVINDIPFLYSIQIWPCTKNISMQAQEWIKSFNLIPIETCSSDIMKVEKNRMGKPNKNNCVNHSRQTHTLFIRAAEKSLCTVAGNPEHTLPYKSDVCFSIFPPFMFPPLLPLSIRIISYLPFFQCLSLPFLLSLFFTNRFPLIIPVVFALNLCPILLYSELFA